MRLPTKVQFYIGERNGRRVSVLVDGYTQDGMECIPADAARSIEAARNGGPYHHLTYLEEPVATSRVAYGLYATTSA